MSSPLPPSAQNIFPVLGMHRSGTSMVTRALNLLGMELGEYLQPPGKANPRGFWEHRLFQVINMQFLESGGMHPSGYGNHATLIDFNRRAGSYRLGAKFEEQLINTIQDAFVSPCWGWKDPRTVVLWSFWLRLFQEKGYTNVRPVVVFRDPSATIQSLQRRGDVRSSALKYGMPIHDFLMSMWCGYNIIILRSPDWKNHLYVRQEDLLDPEKAELELLRLSHHIGGDSSAVPDALAWIDPSLDNRESKPGPVSPAAAELYRNLCARQEEQRAEFLKNMA